MYPEVIISKAKKIFQKLKNFPNFYLAGGTALALQLCHRISIDFDFFWGKEVPKDLLSKTKKVFEDSKVEIIVNHSEQLTIKANGVHLTFAKYPFPVISKFILYQGIKILPAIEIGAMKAYALGRRATFKDYVDLYFLLKEKRASLEKIIKLCQKKYQEGFDPRLFLEQLIYLKDVEKMKIQFLKEKVEIEEIEKFFEKEIKKIKI